MSAVSSKKRLADNSEKPRKKGGAGRPFPRGVSPNPGGRPRSTEANELIRELFKEKGGAAVKRLYELCADKDPRIALAAIDKVLDRVLGKPSQAMDIRTTEVPVSREQVIGELRKELLKRAPKLVEQIAVAFGGDDG